MSWEPVRWALYATTVFFGALLVFGGLVTVAVALWHEVPSRVVALVAGGMAGFWLIGAVYEVLVPFGRGGRHPEGWSEICEVRGDEPVR